MKVYVLYVFLLMIFIKFDYCKFQLNSNLNLLVYSKYIISKLFFFNLKIFLNFILKHQQIFKAYLWFLVLFHFLTLNEY